MEPATRDGSRILWGVLVAIGALIAAFFLLGRIFGSDYRRSPISLSETDVGARVVVEPGDEFELGLLGHPGSPSAGWVIVAVDRAVVSTLEDVHQPAGTTAPDADALARLPEPLRGLWSTLPERTGPPDVVDDAEGPMWYWPLTHFLFEGSSPGETELRLELRVDGDLVHTFVIDVLVTDGDACDYFEGQESPVKVPHRCG